MTVESLGKRVRMWQKRMNLDHWRVQIAIVDEPEGDRDAWASVSCSGYYDTARMQFRRDGLDRPKQTTDEVIVHELLHVHFRDLDDAQNEVCGFLSPDAERAYKARVDHETEGVIERLARVIVNAYSE